MAEEHRNRGPPHRNDHLDDSQYPPPPGEDEDRSRAIAHHPRPQMAAGPVTLPSIQDPHGAYGPPAARGWDPRANNYGASPNSTNGYPPPPGSAQAPHNGYSPSSSSSGGYPAPSNHQYLPPVQPHPHDPRASYPPDPRQGPYYPQQQRPPMQPYGANSYDFAYRPERGPPGAYPQDYGRGGPGPGVMQQSAPRQRTSIACKYCRRRKVSLGEAIYRSKWSFEFTYANVFYRYGAAATRIRLGESAPTASR